MNVVLFLPIFLITVLGPAFGLWIYFRTREQFARRIVEAKLDHLSSSGHPIDNSSHEQWYRSRTSDRLSKEWLEVFAELNSDSFRSLAKGVAHFDSNAEGTGPESPGWPGEEKYRAFYEATLQLREKVRRISLHPTPAQLPIDFRPFSPPMEFFQDVRHLARFVSLETEIALVDGDSMTLARSLETQFDVSNAFSNAPFLVGLLVWLAIDGIAESDLKRAIESDVLNDKDLRSIAAKLNSRPLSIHRWRSVIDSERAFAIPGFLKLTIAEVTNKRRWFLLRRARATSQDLLHFLALMEKMYDAQQETFVQSIQTIQSIEKANWQSMREASFLTRRDWLVSAELSSVSSRVYELLVRNSIMQQQLELAIAIQRYERVHGEFPQSLSEIQSSSSQADSFGALENQLIRYQVRDDRVVLWSPPYSYDGCYLEHLRVPRPEPWKITKEMDEVARFQIECSMIEFKRIKQTV